MNFSNDRDLLIDEPMLFADLPFASQQRVSVDDGVLSGSTLTSATADFEAAQVGPGDVVIIAGVVHEVLSRVDANHLEVSLLRTYTTDEAIPSTAGTNLTIQARTFAPQAAIIHDELLRMLGIAPDDPEAELNEDSIVSLSLMARLEALGVLARVYAGGAAVAGDNQELQRKQSSYQRRFREQITRAVVLIDIDGDGFADEQRRLGVVRLERV